jgi:hypothetical protein
MADMEAENVALPREIMESQLSTVDLLMAMFPLAEIEIPAETNMWMERLRAWCDELTENPPQGVPENITFILTLSVFDRPEIMQMHISVPLRSRNTGLLEPPPFAYFLRQPAWMNKADVTELVASMPQDDAFTAIDYLREESCRFVKSAPALDSNDSKTDKGPVIRVWYYFPSLSTREKRDDLVNHAPGYDLTGFVLAGKPGVLCLEGTSINIDKYMNFIKTNSWGDIPSHQKKVSERYREQGSLKDGGENILRVFGGMQEITNDLGDRGGKRANRGDMKALELWLQEKGLGDAFGKVIF